MEQYNGYCKHKLQKWTIEIHTDKEHCLNEEWKKKHEEKLVSQRKRTNISIRLPLTFTFLIRRNFQLRQKIQQWKKKKTKMAVDYNAVKCKNSYLLWKVNEQFCNSKILFRPFFSFAVYTHFVECKKKLNGNNGTERESETVKNENESCIILLSACRQLIIIFIVHIHVNFCYRCLCLFRLSTSIPFACG